VKRALLLFLVATAAGCTTPLAVGERLYREGDRLGALETWRSIPEDSSEYEESQQRIGVVEEEFDRLVDRHKGEADKLKEKDHLAESILEYRFALKLQPDDADTLARVQQLARTVASRKAGLKQQYDEAFGEGKGDLAAAQKIMDQLLALDPIDPEVQIDKRALDRETQRVVELGLDAGRRRFKEGNYTDAEHHFRRVLALDPYNESAQDDISLIAAIQSRERSASDDEHQAERFYLKAMAEEQSGRNARAEEQSGKKALAEGWERHFYAAIQDYKRALKLDPGHQDAQQHLNEMLSELSGLVGEMIEDGRSAYRNEDLEKARDWWRLAALVDPENERARAYVDRAERGIENLKRLRSEPDVPSRGE
jgi:tetratricopeptide (TPR) repeat protein